jgi:hypothetical protein
MQCYRSEVIIQDRNSRVILKLTFYMISLADENSRGTYGPENLLYSVHSSATARCAGIPVGVSICTWSRGGSILRNACVPRLFKNFEEAMDKVQKNYVSTTTLSPKTFRESLSMSVSYFLCKVDNA